MGRLAVAALALLLGLCEEPAETSAPTPPVEHEPVVAPAAPCELAADPVRFDGRAPALTAGAIVIHGDEATTLHRLDDEGRSTATFELPGPVRALEDVGDGYVTLAVGERPSLAILDADGAEEHRVELGGAAVDGALAVEGDVAFVLLRDEPNAIRSRRVDLLSHRASDPLLLGEGTGRLLVSAQLASWTDADAAVHGHGDEVEHAGTPHAVVGETLVYRSADRTGLWVGADEPVRLTPPSVHPLLPLAATTGELLLLAYRSEGELWVQPADLERGAAGTPALVAEGATPAGLATRGERFWIAWEATGAEGVPIVWVRAGRCSLD